MKAVTLILFIAILALIVGGCRTADTTSDGALEAEETTTADETVETQPLEQASDSFIDEEEEIQIGDII